MLPEPDYLRKIGELAYRVSYFEWAILGDLIALEVPERELNIRALIDAPTGTIARKLRSATPHWKTDRPALYAWATLAADALEAIAIRRNHVLHARPAMDGRGQQRLNRDTTLDGQRTEFWITEDFLDVQIVACEEALRQVNDLRVLGSDPEKSTRQANRDRAAAIAAKELGRGGEAARS